MKSCSHYVQNYYGLKQIVPLEQVIETKLPPSQILNMPLSTFYGKIRKLDAKWVPHALGEVQKNGLDTRQAI